MQKQRHKALVEEQDEYLDEINDVAMCAARLDMMSTAEAGDLQATRRTATEAVTQPVPRARSARSATCATPRP